MKIEVAKPELDAHGKPQKAKRVRIDGKQVTVNTYALISISAETILANL